jgi:hypothetical protein
LIFSAERGGPQRTNAPLSPGVRIFLSALKDFSVNVSAGLPGRFGESSTGKWDLFGEHAPRLEDFQLDRPPRPVEADACDDDSN